MKRSKRKLGVLTREEFDSLVKAAFKHGIELKPENTVKLNEWLNENIWLKRIRKKH